MENNPEAITEFQDMIVTVIYSKATVFNFLEEEAKLWGW
jgi:hypothetical protein